MALPSLRVKNATILGISDDRGVTKKSLFSEVFVQNLLQFFINKVDRWLGKKGTHFLMPNTCHGK
jgi:hypothetical protein